MQREITKLQGSFAQLQAAMQAARQNADRDDRGKVYNKQLQQLQQLRSAYNDAAMATGGWGVQTVKNISASEAFTDRIRKQKLSMGELTRAIKEYKRTAGAGVLGEAIKEQQALRNATATQMGTNMFGKNVTDLHVPRTIDPSLDNVRTKMGLINQAIGAAATNMVNFGKNTQWAGRQITVGLTMPVGMAAVGAAALALDVDKQLTRIAKVYDTNAKSEQGQIVELNGLREAGLKTAVRAANEYGMAMKDTLDIQAQLAAAGFAGAGLQQMTTEVARIATLGEVDTQQSIDMTVALRTAFRDTIEDTQDLTDAFNYMNVVENQTSLGIADIAEAVPRAAGAIAQLGGTVQDMTVMMVAMKESGINPAEGANALKSATTRLLDPTKEAVEYFKTSFGIDLPKVVEEAGGNIYDLMQTLAKRTQGLDPLQIQTGIGKLFGTYQFNRLTALWTNLGQAANGVQNQTFAAMQALNMSSEQMATIAEKELSRWQESVQGKFKRAVEGIKASLFDLGIIALSVITPAINALKFLIDGFNDLPISIKGTVLGLLALGAVIGPLMMFGGIAANLFGSMIKFGSSVMNLKYKFGALNAEEAAAEIMAKRAASAFNTEAGAAAQLSLQLQALTKTMERNAIAQGAMMGANGQIANRQVVQGRKGLEYTAGSKDEKGNSLAGKAVSQEDVAMFGSVKQSVVQVEESSERTARNWKQIGTYAGGAAGAAGLIATLLMNASGASGMLLTTLTVATTALAMWPGAIGAIGSGIMGAVGSLNKIPSVFTGKIIPLVTRFKTLMGTAVTFGGARGGISALPGIISSILPRFSAFAVHALKIFGPLGVIAGGVYYVKQVADEFNRAKENAEALAGSGEAWANAVGFTYTPGTLPGMGESDDVDQYARRKEIVAALSKENAALATSLVEAGRAQDDFTKAQHVAMTQALRMLNSGATQEQASEVLGAALDIAGMKGTEIDRMVVDFKEMDLSDPAGVRNKIMELQKDIFADVPAVNPMANKQDSAWESVLSFGRELVGGDLTSEMQAAGVTLGESLYNGMIAAGQNERFKLDMFNNLRDQSNEQFSGMVEDLRGQDANLDAALSELGVTTADGLAEVLSSIREKVENNEELTSIEAQLWRNLNSPEGVGPELQRFEERYQEFLDQVILGLGRAMGLSDEKIEELRSQIGSLFDVGADQGVNENLMSVEQAMAGYEEAVSRGASSWAKLNDNQKLGILNAHRAKAGLEGATHWTQGFGDAADHAAGQVRDLANATAAIEPTADQLTNQLKSSMSGTMDDIYEEANRIMQEQHSAEIEGIRAAGERRSKALDARGKREDKHFKQREKALEDSQERETEIFEDNWDNRIKGEEDYWENQLDMLQDRQEFVRDDADRRIDLINDQLEAEEKADEERERIFEREKTRIERMAQLYSNNIDFNAALNTGDLDEAAKIYGNNEATVQQWGIDDQQLEAGDASERRRDEANSRIEQIEAERDAELDRLEKQEEAIQHEKEVRLEALRQQREAETKAFQDRLEQNRELLAAEREAAQERLAAARDADNARTQSAINSANAQHAADQRSLAARLRELQAFTPRNEGELRAHIGRVEAMYGQYGINLQGHGNNWAGFIGNALRQNVTNAAIALQNDINWQAMGQVIADRLGQGAGMSAGEMEFLIKNGRMMKTDPVGKLMDTIKASAQGIDLRRHSGGLAEVGGPAWSSKERMGVPRNAAPYPSEMVTLLKRGEYVVNEKATRKNFGLLESINSGQSLHTGGLAGGVMAAGINHGFTMAAALSSGLQQLIDDNSPVPIYNAAMQHEGIAGGGAFSGAAPGGSQIDRMFNTIKQNFPKARLNSSMRPGDPGYHGRGKAIDLGLQGVPGGAGNQYMADMNRWIHDRIPNVTELIYDGLGDDRPDLKNGRPLVYNAGTRAAHRNHVHWAMQSFHKGGLLPNLNTGGFTLSEGLANLHPGEAVLTKPLTQEFANNVANGGENQYHVEVNFNGPVTSEIDVERAVERAISKRESRNGRRRVV